MPYLNWKQTPLGHEIREHERGSLLVLSLGRSERDELVQRLQGVFERGEGELRVDLPQEWIVFWKLRETESRLLIAHPQDKEWVTTIALDAGHGAKLLKALIQLETGSSVVLGELAPIGNVSNVEVVIQAV